MCFMKQGIKFTEGLTRMTWFLLVLLFDITRTNTQNIQGPIDDTHECILIPTVMCSKQLPVLH